MIKENKMNWSSIRNKMTYSEVKNIEKQINVAFPEDYCKLIGNINGAALKKGYIIHPVLGKISYSRNTNLDSEVRGNALQLFEVLDDSSKKYFPIASVGNGDYYCIDLKNKRIVLYQHETGEVTLVCDTFTELLSMICEE